MRKRVFVILFFIFSFVIHLTEETKVSRRFENLYSPNARCLVQMLSYYSNWDTKQTPGHWRGIMDSVFNFHRLNCSFAKIDYTSTGLPDVNGTYDGLVGNIQRNEQDIAFVFVRPDSLPFEPGKITPPFGPADAVIISHRNASKETVYELTHFLALDDTVYIYSGFYLFFIFAFFYTFCETFLITKQFNLSILFKKYQETVFKIISLLADQENFQTVTNSGMILALSVCLFSFMGIHAILLNNISADLVVNVKPQLVNSLDDLLARPIQPIIVKKLFIYQLLKAAPENSNLHKLWLKINEKPEGLFDYDIANAAESFPKTHHLLKRINQSDSALILPNIFIDTTFKPYMCTFFYKYTVQFKVSDELFAPGLLTGIMSHKTHPYVEKVINYLLRTLFENELMMGASKLSTANMGEMVTMMGQNYKYNGKVIQCIESRNENQQDTAKFSVLKLQDFSTLFRAYLLLSLLALIPHLIDGVMKARPVNNFTPNYVKLRVENVAITKYKLSKYRRQYVKRRSI